MVQLFQYGFVMRGLEVGIIVAIVAPLIGTFLVLRRYSLIADTLAHVSLAGVAIGLLLKLNPILTALGVTALSSLGIERLRNTRKIYGESALALFLSGSLALAIVLLSFGKGLNTSLFSYLFGNIMTVTQTDVITIIILAVIVVASLKLFYKELVYITFDEESAQVSGIPVKRFNTILMLMAAFTISFSIQIIGVLLIAALMVIPVIAALQLRRSFSRTILYAEMISLFSVLSGIWISFYFNLSTGGTTVLMMLVLFLAILAKKRLSS